MVERGRGAPMVTKQAHPSKSSASSSPDSMRGSMTEGSPTPRPTPFAAAGMTDVGRQRRHNEDHVLVRRELGLFAVADGMGGHNAGDVASKLAATSLCNYFEATA